jgi:hypothetical protein
MKTEGTRNVSDLERRDGPVATEEPARGQTALPSELAASIATLSPAQLELLHAQLKKLNAKPTGDQRQRQRITRRRRDSDTAVLSFAQQRMWFLEQLTPGTATYNIPCAIRLSGRLDVAALERSLNEIVRRHETLRTTFADRDGRPIQIVSESLALPLSFIDLRGLGEVERAARAASLLNDDAQQPFDITRGPLLRATLVRVAEEEEYVLLLTIHHIICDKWSLDVFLRELVLLYGAFSRNQPSPLPELPFQYADFAQWQQEHLSDEMVERQLAFWKKQLEGATPYLNLPTDHPRPDLQSFRGARYPVSFPGELAEEIDAFSQREGGTFFITALAAFKALLHVYTKQADILLGTTILGRHQPEAEALIGFFANTLVLRTDLSGDPTFRELLARMRQMMLDSHAHQDLPFEKLVERLCDERDPSRHPFFQVMFNLQSSPVEELTLPDLTFNRIEADSGTVKFDLTIFLLKSARGLNGFFIYNKDLFEVETITRLTEDYESVLRHVAGSPDARLSELADMLARERSRRQAAKRDEMRRANLEKLKTLGRAPVGRRKGGDA